MLGKLKRFIVSDRHFYVRVFLLAMPIALQSLITVGVNMLDTKMVASLGEDQLSATSLANQFINMYHIFCMGIGMGASVLVSRYWGMVKNSNASDEIQARQSLKKTICLMLRLAFGLACFFALITLLMPEQIMRLYGVDEEVIPYGVTYLRYSVVTYFFLGLSLVSTIALRSVGQVLLPLIVSIFAFFINLGANYAFIFGHFNMPRMEVAGAAIGTLIARIFEMTVIVGYLLFVDKKICFRVRHIFMHAQDLLGEYIRISIPVLISDMILAFGNNSVAMIIGRLGKTFVAANAVTAITQQLSTVVIQGVSQAGAIVTGQTLGFGDREKAMREGYGFFGLGVFLGLIAGVIVFASSGFVIASYDLTPETGALAKQLMYAISFILVFQGTNSIMTKGVLRGGGDTKMLMLTDNVFLWAVSIPLGIVAGFVLKLPAFMIYVCLKADQIIKAIWCLFRLKSGKWIKKIKVAKKASEND